MLAKQGTLGRWFRREYVPERQLCVSAGTRVSWRAVVSGVGFVLFTRLHASLSELPWRLSLLFCEAELGLLLSWGSSACLFLET